jgi:spore germination protein GerM
MSSRSRERRRLLAAVAALASVCVLTASCGATTQSEPVALGHDGVPFALLEEPTTTVPPTIAPDDEYPFVVYFEGDDGVVPVLRTASERPNVQHLLRTLLAGPTEAEAAVGMRTAIPPRAVQRVRRVSGRMAIVDLLRPFTQVSGSEQQAALAQIVLTMTALPEVSRVRFRIGGDPVSVPRANGTVTREPVRREDYTTS